MINRLYVREISKCNDCPALKFFIAVKENVDVCGSPFLEEQRLIKDANTIPEWCPLEKVKKE